MTGAALAGAFDKAKMLLQTSASKQPDGGEPALSAGPSAPGLPTDAEARAILRIGALARQWRQTDEDKKTGYLILDKETLAQASLYAHRDPDISALVAASKMYIDARRNRTWGGLFLFVVVAAMVAFWAFKEAEYTQLRATLAAESAERDRIRQDVRAAVDALRSRNIQPLRRFLYDFGGADADDLRTIELAAINPENTFSEAVPTPAQRGNTAGRQPAASRAASCSGFLWLGAKGNASRLADHRDPATLQAGETVTLDQRDDIRLRSDLPSDSYVMSPQIGLVPAGAQVKILSAPKPYPRGSVDQIWAQVEVPRAFCTTVFVQYSGPVAKRDEVMKALRDLGVQSPPAQQIDTAKGLAAVRYFWPEDKPLAEQVAATLASFNDNTKLAVVPLTDFPKKPSSGTIEVWLDFNRTKG